jgi:hypothetical protein
MSGQGQMSIGGYPFDEFASLLFLRNIPTERPPAIAGIRPLRFFRANPDCL